MTRSSSSSAVMCSSEERNSSMDCLTSMDGFLLGFYPLADAVQTEPGFADLRYETDSLGDSLPSLGTLPALTHCANESRPSGTQSGAALSTRRGVIRIIATSGFSL